MTRSIGDLVAGSVGVTWKPEIAIYKLCQEDRIITIASDGIWEVLDNSDVRNHSNTLSNGLKVINIVKKHVENNIEKACDILMEKCLNKWSGESMIDDITFVVLHMH